MTTCTVTFGGHCAFTVGRDRKENDVCSCIGTKRGVLRTYPRSSAGRAVSLGNPFLGQIRNH
jgi:hypothetical protein